MLLQMSRVLGGIRPPLTRSVLKAFLGPTTFRTRRGVVDAIPGAEFVVLDGVAHLAALEDPAAVNALIANFLAR